MEKEYKLLMTFNNSNYNKETHNEDFYTVYKYKNKIYVKHLEETIEFNNKKEACNYLNIFNVVMEAFFAHELIIYDDEINNMFPKFWTNTIKPKIDTKIIEYKHTFSTTEYINVELNGKKTQFKFVCYNYDRCLDAYYLRQIK